MLLILKKCLIIFYGLLLGLFLACFIIGFCSLIFRFPIGPVVGLVACIALLIGVKNKFMSHFYPAMDLAVDRRWRLYCVRLLIHSLGVFFCLFYLAVVATHMISYLRVIDSDYTLFVPWFVFLVFCPIIVGKIFAVLCIGVCYVWRYVLKWRLSLAGVMLISIIINIACLLIAMQFFDIDIFSDIKNNIDDIQWEWRTSTTPLKFLKAVLDKSWFNFLWITAMFLPSVMVQVMCYDNRLGERLGCVDA